MGDVNAQHVQAVGLTVNGNAQITGLTNAQALQATSLQVAGNTQLQNVQTDSISTDYLSANNITTGNINSGQYLLNGIPITSSQWTSTGSDIYYNGNVGIGTTVPFFPLEVQGNAAITGTLFVDRLAAQTSITIGQFRFTNGATTPGAADSIITPARLVVEAQGSISYETDTVRMGNVRFVSTQYETQVTAQKGLLLEAVEVLTLRTAAEKVVLDADTVIAKERVGIGRDPEVALDVVGDIRASGNITAVSLIVRNAEFDSLYVKDSIKIGNTIWLGGQWGNTNNSIYSIDGDLAIQSNNPGSGFTYNTIINSGVYPQNGSLGIGTATPLRKVHIRSKNWETIPSYVCQTCGQVEPGLRLEHEYVPNSGSSIISSWDIVPVNSPSRLQINSVNTNKTVLTLYDNGRVGIGTTSPYEKLTIKGVNNAVNFGIQRSSNTRNVFAVVETAAGAGRSYIYDANGNRDILLATDGNVYFNNSGNVGIGNTNPAATLHVTGKTAFAAANADLSLGMLTATGVQIHQPTSSIPPDGEGEVALIIGDTSARSMLFVPYLGDVWYNSIVQEGDIGIIYRNQKDNAGRSGFVITPQGGPHKGIRITPDGNVHMGRPITSGPHQDFRLAVDGKIVARSYKATITGWADYVFKPGHKLMTPKEKKHYIDEFGHLYGFPSAAELKKDGIDLVETDKQQQVVIEENVLHIIDHDERIEELEKENKELQKQLKQLKKRLNNLEKNK